MRPSFFVLPVLILAACGERPLVNGGDELSPFVGLPVTEATAGIESEGYVSVGVEDGSEYFANRRTRACARTQIASGRLITVVQLPTAVCQTVSR